MIIIPATKHSCSVVVGVDSSDPIGWMNKQIEKCVYKQKTAQSPVYENFVFHMMSLDLGFHDSVMLALMLSLTSLKLEDSIETEETIKIVLQDECEGIDLNLWLN